MTKKLLIIFIALLLLFLAASLYFRNSDLYPSSRMYFFKKTGEWLDVNFLTFGAPEKQAKHLEYAERRLQEFLELAQQSNPDIDFAKLDHRYESELASAEFMAEQLALLDHRFIPQIEQVYKTTLHDLGRLDAPPNKTTARNSFAASAQLYNQKSIKVLLQKHQHTPVNTSEYKDLIETRLQWLESQDNFSKEQQSMLNEAKKILKEGRELEWAYDLLSGIR